MKFENSLRTLYELFCTPVGVGDQLSIGIWLPQAFEFCYFAQFEGKHYKNFFLYKIDFCVVFVYSSVQ